MFHDLPEALRARMAELEAIDARDRTDGTPHRRRLRQVPPETGRFLALLAAAAPAGAIVEVGTSAGYSTLWLALAARASGRTVTTFEVLPEKVALARETFARAGVEDVVRLVEGDARDAVAGLDAVGFAFLDAEKGAYPALYEALLPRLVPGGPLAADNVLSHAEVLGPFVDRVIGDRRVDAVVVPIGKGVLLARRPGARATAGGAEPPAAGAGKA
ncbi:O-methyltransferase [Oceanithermus profundus]